MAKLRLTLAIMILTACALFAKDKLPYTYELGTYITSTAVDDGTVTDSFNCGSRSLGSTTCYGGMRFNQVSVYRIQVANGIWIVETDRQVGDESLRRLGVTPMHLTSEKQNPLDLLRNGDKVLFRVEDQRNGLLGGRKNAVYIPFANNPNKEEKYIGNFSPTIAPVKLEPQSDIVRAMCDAHKLTLEQEKQLCMDYK